MMSLRKAELLTTLLAMASLIWLAGCAEETPQVTGPMSGGPQSNMTLSGYMRSGVTFGH
jgi:hypothetical protein